MRNLVILGLGACSLLAFFSPFVLKQPANARSTQSQSANPPVSPNRVVHPQAERWREMFTEFDLPLFNIPQVRYVSRDETGVFVTVQNSGQTLLCYQGYGRSNPQQCWESRFTGEWKAEGCDWCGTGLGRYTIKPGEGVELYVSSFDNTDGYARVLTCFTEAGTQRSELIVLADHGDLDQVPYIPSRLRQAVPTP